MSRPRLSGETPSQRLINLAHKNGRLEGKSDGRTWGRIEERSLIVKWLKRRPEGDARQVAVLIENGAHARK